MLSVCQKAKVWPVAVVWCCINKVSYCKRIACQHCVTEIIGQDRGHCRPGKNVQFDHHAKSGCSSSKHM